MKIIIRWQPLALIGLALLGLALRLYGLNWDAGNSFHPDERQILFHVTALTWPQSFAEVLDAANSPLNPHFFAYGSFPLYLLAGLGNILSRFFPSLNTFANLTLVGRVLNALFDTGTILLTGCLGLRLANDSIPGRPRAWKLALLAAAFVTFTPLQLQLSHFYAVDTMLLFFVMLTLLACVALVETDAPIRWSLVAGLSFGLALATKFSAAPLAVPLLIAALMRWYRRDWLSALTSFLVSLSITVLVFLIAMPYALLDFRNFVEQVSEQGNLARGLLDLPYVRQFAGTTPYVYEVQNIVLWGMGVTLGVVAFAGLAWLLWRTWKRDAGLWLVVLAWVLAYSAITGSFYVKFMRYMLPVYPLLTLMGAALLLAFVDFVGARLIAPQEGSGGITEAVGADSVGLARASYVSRGGGRSWAAKLFPYAVIGLVLAGTMFQGLALLNVYSEPNTRVQASRWMFSHLRPGSVLTYEQWDDPLPVPVDGHDPFIFQQATYPDINGQPQTGLDLYGDDTVEKARQLANILPTVDAITMATDRLDKSILRLPFRYPLTIHYYQLLFSGQLGFHLAAKFENHPSLFGITLDDSGADESYSVFDHPTTRIFVRDKPYPYTPDQLFQKLLEGVQLPTPGAGLSGAQRSLLLTPQQIADDQQSPPFGDQFPLDSPSNAAPIFFWWFALTLIGLLVYPLVFSIFRVLADRGYIFSKTLGLLLLAYIPWLLASLHIIAFSRLSLLLVLDVLLLCALMVCWWQRETISNFLRQHWRLLLLEELLFTFAFLLFVGIRSLNPDLWQIFLGGEKPQELAFLNAVLRSPYMPPYDPWFAGGYINYYYYGYIIIGALIKLTGIVPTTAFNLAIPTLFALTFSGVVSLVYSLTRRFSVALLGGYFAALIGNFNGLAQLKGQIAALLAHMQAPMFDYWQSSRIIPFTINEFPFWSFLFADLHPHVIDLPIAVLMLGILAALILTEKTEEKGPFIAPQARRFIIPQMRGPQGIVPIQVRQAFSLQFGRRRWENGGLYLLAAFVFGTIACVNTWDMPVYALLLAVALVIRTVQNWQASAGHLQGNGVGEVRSTAPGRDQSITSPPERVPYGVGIASLAVQEQPQNVVAPTRGAVGRGARRVELLVSLGFSLVGAAMLCGLGYLFYWPFYASYQQLYVNGLGIVKLGTGLGDYLTIFGLWLFLALSFFLVELYLWWTRRNVGSRLIAPKFTSRRITGYLLLSGVVLTFVILLGLKQLLAMLIVLGAFLFFARWKGEQRSIVPTKAQLIGSPEVQFTSLDVGNDEKDERNEVPTIRFTYLLLLMGLCICLGMELVYVRDFLDGGDYERMNTVFKFSMQAWLCFAIAGALVVYRLWRLLSGRLRRTWSTLLVVLVVGCSVFLTEGTASRIADHQVWVNVQKPVQSADYTPTLDGFAFVRAWYPADAKAISWLNANVVGSPIILEAASPASYQWFNRVSVFTGLPDVLGWSDHVAEQRYDYQPLNRLTDITLIYTDPDPAQAIELLRYYHVHYIYVGPLERQVYAQQSSAGLDKFDQMVGSTLRVVYRSDGVTIYEMV